jgi:hypothetical protein
MGAAGQNHCNHAGPLLKSLKTITKSYHQLLLFMGNGAERAAGAATRTLRLFLREEDTVALYFMAATALKKEGEARGGCGL